MNEYTSLFKQMRLAKVILLFLLTMPSISHSHATTWETLINTGKWANAKQWLLNNKSTLLPEQYYCNHITLCFLLNEQEINKVYCDSLLQTSTYNTSNLAKATYNWAMARYYQYHQQPNIAINYAKQAALFADKTNNPKTQALCYLQLANTLRGFKNIDKVLYAERFVHANKGLALIPLFNKNDYFYQAKIYQLAALIWFDEVQTSLASAKPMISKLTQSTHLLLTHHSKHPQLIHNQILLGYAWAKLNTDSALIHYQKAEKMLIEINDLSHGVLIYLSASLFHLTDEAYEQKFNETGNQDYLHRALVWAKNNLWLDYNKLQYEGFYFYRRYTDKTYLPIEQRIANLYYLLYAKTNNQNYLKFALRYAEYLRHKPITQIGASKLVYGSLPNLVLIENGHQTSNAIQFKQTENLVTQPEYVAQFVKPNEAIIAYFCYNPKNSDTVTFLVQCIEKSNQQNITIKVTKNQLSNIPQEMLDAINHDDDDAYGNAAYQGYKLFLEPVLKNLAKHTNKLTILPPVYYNTPLIFEGFVSSKNKIGFNQFKYVFDDYNICYTPSYTHFVATQKHHIPVQQVNIWNPDYTETPFAEITEASNINSNIKRYFNTQLVSYQNKKELANNLLNAPILQIAAHASANFENLERPLIYTELNNTDSVLYDIDLEQLNSNNTLTVFAACKSSVGYVQYNGVIDGFSRAVLSAGGSGTITALFNVEEHITVQTLNLFYQHLGEGLTASDALYLAKKEIKRKFSHPKKWQAFVYNGSSISFVSQSKTTNLSLLGLAMLVFVALTISLIKAEF